MLDSFQSSLALYMVEVLICTQNFLKSSSVTFDAQQDMIEDAGNYQVGSSLLFLFAA